MTESEALNFRQDLSPLQGIRETQTVLTDGKITQIVMHFPSGCNGLVNVKVLRGSSPILPRDGFIALDNTTEKFDLDIKVRRSETITVVYENTDGTYSHKISVIVQILPEVV